MSNITFKLNLRQFNSMEVTTKKGKKGIFIPYKENHVFEGEKGAYVDFSAFELRNATETGTHIIKQQLPKAVYASLSDADKKAMPIIGNLKVWGSGNRQEPEPKDFNMPEGDDLPF